MITLKQLEAFYWVGMLGSFAATAEKIHVAQSTVSKRIQEMEMILGIELFDREMRTGRLTPKGIEILPLAEKMLRLRDKFSEAAQNTEAITGLLRIGITELVAVTWLPNLLARIRSTYPQIVLEPVVDQVVNLYRRLEDRSVDFVIGPRVYKDDRFNTALLKKVEQAWMCSPDLIPGDAVVPLRTFKDIPLLMQATGSGQLFMIDRLFNDNNVRPKSVITCNGMMALAEMASAGLGLTCLPPSYFGPELASGRLKIVRSDPPLPDLLYAVAARRDAVGNLGTVISAMVVECCDFTASPRKKILQLT